MGRRQQEETGQELIQGGSTETQRRKKRMRTEGTVKNLQETSPITQSEKLSSNT